MLKEATKTHSQHIPDQRRLQRLPDQPASTPPSEHVSNHRPQEPFAGYPLRCHPNEWVSSFRTGLLSRWPLLTAECLSQECRTLTLYPSTTEVLDVAPIDVIHGIYTKFIEDWPEQVLPSALKKESLDMQFIWVSEHGAANGPMRLTSNMNIVATASISSSRWSRFQAFNFTSVRKCQS